MNPLREIGRSMGNAVAEQVGRAAGRLQESRPLPYDLLESDEAYLAIVDVPGTMASDVQVRYVDGAVLVRVDRFRDFREGFSMRFPGRGLALDGRIELPADAAVDAAGASATLRTDGTLEITVPKAVDVAAMDVSVATGEPEVDEASDAAEDGENDREDGGHGGGSAPD